MGRCIYLNKIPLSQTDCWPLCIRSESCFAETRNHRGRVGGGGEDIHRERTEFATLGLSRKLRRPGERDLRAPSNRVMLERPSQAMYIFLGHIPDNLGLG